MTIPGHEWKVTIPQYSTIDTLGHIDHIRRRSWLWGKDGWSRYSRHVPSAGSPSVMLPTIAIYIRNSSRTRSTLLFLQRTLHARRPVRCYCCKIFRGVLQTTALGELQNNCSSQPPIDMINVRVSIIVVHHLFFYLFQPLPHEDAQHVSDLASSPRLLIVQLIFPALCAFFVAEFRVVLAR